MKNIREEIDKFRNFVLKEQDDILEPEPIVTYDYGLKNQIVSLTNEIQNFIDITNDEELLSYILNNLNQMVDTLSYYIGSEEN